MTKTKVNGGLCELVEPNYDMSLGMIQLSTYHGHDLRDGRVGNAELVDDGWKDKRNAPSTNSMGDPNHEEGDEGRVPQQVLHLLDTESLGIHCRCLVREIVEDGLSFGLA